MAKLYTNAICPFAHRAHFAAALCSLDVEIVHTPLAGQVTAAQKLGMEGVNVGACFAGKSVEDIAAQKEEYKKLINASGEVPTLVTAAGDIVIESEIVAECIDATAGTGLMPSNPAAAGKVRLAMKRFGDVVMQCYGLLLNQDPAADADKAKTLTAKLAKFAEALDKEGEFCFGDKPTLADVHVGPFLYRFNILLPFYRGFDLFADQPSDRLRNVLSKIEALPEFQKLAPITADDLIGTYAAYANGQKWADAPTIEKKWAGRGKAEFGGLGELAAKKKPVLYTNVVCPFAHRGAFAVSLCSLDVEVVHTPLAGQIATAEKLGMESIPLGECFAGKSVADIATQKEEYKKLINASGEVPSLVTAGGDIAIESEIVAECVDSLAGGGLMPSNPAAAARVRLAMKRFNDVVAQCYGLLLNQDPAADAEKAKTLTAKLAKFAEAIDKEGEFCFGDKPTLADVHAGPFLYRFNILLPFYRGFDLFADQPSDRLRKLGEKIETMPEFQRLTPVTADGLIATYAAYAHGHKWADAPTKENKYAGRGKSEFGK